MKFNKKLFGFLLINLATTITVFCMNDFEKRSRVGEIIKDSRFKNMTDIDLLEKYRSYFSKPGEKGLNKTWPEYEFSGEEEETLKQDKNSTNCSSDESDESEDSGGFYKTGTSKSVNFQEIFEREKNDGSDSSSD